MVMVKEKELINDYTEDQIDVLEGLEAVRKRPGMYIGSIDERGLHHLIWEIFDNSIDEALAGFANEITIILENDNSCSIKDNGRGIPVGIHPKTNISTVETVFTKLHAGGKFGSKNSGYKVSGGLHGVGASVTNALSEYLEVFVHRDSKEYFQRFERGISVEALKTIGDSSFNGTIVKFKADNEIFSSIEFKHEKIKDKVKTTAFLNKGLKIIFIDQRNNKEYQFQYEGGIIDFLIDKNKTKGIKPIHEKIVYSENEHNDIKVEVALQYTVQDNTNVFSFVNNISTNEGGTHEQGFYDALVRLLNNYGVSRNLFKKIGNKLTIEDVKEGLTAIISIKHPNPIYEGQTKTKLSNVEVRKLVNDNLTLKLEKFLDENPKLAIKIIDKCINSAVGRLAAERAKKAAKKKDVLDLGSLPGKLADCSSKDPKLRELFIVEGDSAGGSAKMGRNREFQAILPLRGKIINAEKSAFNLVLNNNEIGTMITSFGVGIGIKRDDFKQVKQKLEDNGLKYHKIILMTDADVDGAHIRNLLLTFFYNHLNPLILGGYLYIACPPLYKIVAGRDIKYVYTENEKNEILSKMINRKVRIQRYKGLGEMNAIELWETTMNPENRLLKQVEIEDFERADEAFTKLMGQEVKDRKEFIMNNAKFAKNIDI